jgi:hypothetical protein
MPRDRLFSTRSLKGRTLSSKEGSASKTPEHQLATGTPNEMVTVAIAEATKMTTEAEYFRHQAKRMHALAQQITDRHDSDQFEAIAKDWDKKAGIAKIREDWRAIRGFFLG